MREKDINAKSEKFLMSEDSGFVGNPAKLEVKNRAKNIRSFFGASTLLLMVSLVILTSALIATNLIQNENENEKSSAPTASELKINKTIEDINNELSDVDEDLAYQEFDDSELSVDDESVDATIEEIDAILELSDSIEDDLGDFDESSLD